MKKVFYALFFPLVVIGGLVFANREIKTETEKSIQKPLTADEKEAERKKWEATPAGIKHKQWEASPEGKKVLDGAAKLRGHITAFTNMKAVVTSLSLPPGSRLGFGVMATIDGVEYIVKFDAQKSQVELLRSLKVNEKIVIKSKAVSLAPKYAYPIINAEYAERDGKIIYKRIPPKDGC